MDACVFNVLLKSETLDSNCLWISLGLQAVNMKALVLEGIQKLRVADIKMPVGNDSETLLQVLYGSVCRTDAKMWAQGQRDLVLPRVLGHEICGQKPDSHEKFVVWPASACHTCHYCKNGAENLCGNIQIIGFHRDGAFAQYIKVPNESLIKVPATVPPEIACMTELLAAAINAVEQADVQENQKVLIYGAGPAGLLLGLACRYLGAIPLMVEKNHEKIKLGAQFCKEVGITVVDTVAAENSDNFNVVINAAPDPHTLSDGIAKLTAGGKYCIFSGFTKNINIPTDLLNEVHYRQLTVVGAYGNTRWQMGTALGILESNARAVSLLIHEIIKLDDVPSVLSEILNGQVMKYVVDLQK